MQINRFVRYSLIISCLNFVFAMIIAIVVVISRVFNWQFQNWQAYDWYIFVSILIPIGVFIVYLSPVIEQKLYNYLTERLISISENQIEEYEKQILSLKSALIEIKNIE